MGGLHVIGATGFFTSSARPLDPAIRRGMHSAFRVLTSLQIGAGDSASTFSTFASVSGSHKAIATGSSRADASRRQSFQGGDEHEMV
jgi:hypothetical protein